MIKGDDKIKLKEPLVGFIVMWVGFVKKSINRLILAVVYSLLFSLRRCSATELEITKRFAPE